MREIVLDTETTGLEPLQGDRVVEIGCVELSNHVATGQHYHIYLNPERPMSEEAAAVHGLRDDFLKTQPVFAEVVDGFLAFIEDSPLVIHNAPFDMGFLNMELGRLGFPQMKMGRAVDTLLIARKKFFGAPVTLDALCKRFDIDSSRRTMHGALLDAELLAEVYLELCGGRQAGLSLGDGAAAGEVGAAVAIERAFKEPRSFPASEEELAAHEAFVKKLKNPMWKRA